MTNDSGVGTLSINDRVFWKWGNGFVEATILEVKYKKTIIESKGKTITRNGTKSNPAIILQTDKAVLVLKLASEVKKV
jgi:hypothetical protein